MKDTAQILEHEEMEIILKTSSMYINFSEMTLEEQSSWVKLVREDLEEAADDIDLFYRKIERFNKNKRTVPESVRKMLNDIRKSESFLLGETHKKLIKELVDFSQLIFSSSVMSENFMSASSDWNTICIPSFFKIVSVSAKSFVVCK